jgi:hypothetical protein
MSVLSQACANLFATRSTRATVGTQTTQVMTDKITVILKPKGKGERCQVQQVQTQTLPGATLCQEGLPNGFLCVPRTFCFHPDLNLAKCCPVSCSTGFLGHSMVVLCRLMGIGWSFDGHWIQATTEQLCQLARLLARRRLRERNYAFRQYLHSDASYTPMSNVLFCFVHLHIARKKLTGRIWSNYILGPRCWSLGFLKIPPWYSLLQMPHNYIEPGPGRTGTAYHLR